MICYFSKLAKILFAIAVVGFILIFLFAFCYFLNIVFFLYFFKNYLFFIEKLIFDKSLNAVNELILYMCSINYEPLSDFINIIINASLIPGVISSGFLYVGQKYKYGFLLQEIARLKYKFNGFYLILYGSFVALSKYFYSENSKNSFYSFIFGLLGICTSIYLLVVFYCCYVSDNRIKSNMIYIYNTVYLCKKSTDEIKKFLIEIMRYVREKYKQVELSDFDLAFECIFLLISEYETNMNKNTNNNTNNNTTILIYELLSILYNDLNESSHALVLFYFKEILKQANKGKNIQFKEEIYDALTLLLIFQIEDSIAMKVITSIPDNGVNDIDYCEIMCRYLYAHLVLYKIKKNENSLERFTKILENPYINISECLYDEENKTNLREFINEIIKNDINSGKSDILKVEKRINNMEKFRDTLLEYFSINKYSYLETYFINDKIRFLLFFVQEYNNTLFQEYIGEIENKNILHKHDIIYKNAYEELYYILLIYDKLKLVGV